MADAHLFKMNTVFGTLYTIIRFPPAETVPPSISGGNDVELYFEENNMDAFLKELEGWPEPVRYLHAPAENAWGKRVVRIADPDGHMIEIGESKDYAAQKQ